jgi:hypothetical protein
VSDAVTSVSDAAGSANGVAIMDARGWQNTLDLKTGEKIDAASPVIDMARDLLHRHPYPGDLDPKSNGWVTDTALDLVKHYNPSLVFLTFASQYFASRYTLMTDGTWATMVDGVFREVERFLTTSGFTGVILGTGDMAAVKGSIDVTRLDGLAVCTHWSARYAGLYGPTPKDLKIIGEHPDIERIVPREALAGIFEGTPEQAAKLPEYLMVGREGHAFKTISDAKRTAVKIPSFNFTIPVHAPHYDITDITGIRGAVEERLAVPSSQVKVALIVVEGVGHRDFPLANSSCSNGIDWYFYEPGEAQYLTALSGRHRFLDFPTGAGSKYLSDAPEQPRNYPFSGHFKSVPEGTIGLAFPGRSVAVGNKSMFMHMATGADVSVECFARNLYNQGTMAVVHRDDKDSQGFG